MPVAPIPVVTDFSYTELKERVEVLSRRVNSLTAMEVSLIDIDQTPSINITEDNSLLKLPDLSQIDCEELAEDLITCDEALVIAQAEIADLEKELEEACDQAPDGGSWGYNRNVYRVANSGTCSGYAHFQRESYNASLAKNITFLGNTVGYGYRIINNNTAVALYRVYNVGSWSPNYRRVIPVRTDQLNTDGSALCNSGMVGIVFAKVNPAKPSGYDSDQGGIAAGAGGIGTYGVFAKTLDTVDGTGVWYPDGPQGVSGSTLIGTITKASAEDLFDYASESSNPCGQKPPPFYTVNYAAGAGGTVTGTSPQYITPDGTGTLITAVPNSGYTFTSWSDGSTIAARQDSNPTSNGTLTANFVLTP